MPVFSVYAAESWGEKTEETLLTLRALGIQTSTLSSSYLLPSDTRFIPTSQIRDIFIHEAFKGFEVRYYLAVVVEGEGEVVVVFPVSGCLLWKWESGRVFIWLDGFFWMEI